MTRARHWARMVERMKLLPLLLLLLRPFPSPHLFQLPVLLELLVHPSS